MKLFPLLGFIINLAFDSSTSVTRLNLFFGCFLDVSRFFKEPTRIVYHIFEAFSRGCISLELEMIRFLEISFQNNWICSSSKIVSFNVKILDKGAILFRRSSLLIRKRYLINDLSKCGLYSSLFQFSSASIIFSTFLLCLFIETWTL